MRLIDSDALIEELNNSHFPGAPYVDAGISIAIGKVLDAPTIEPSAQPEHDENDLDFVQPHKRIPVQLVVSSDCISRQAAIDAIKEYIVDPNRAISEYEDNVFNYNAGLKSAVQAIVDLPPAQPDMSEYSDKLWKRAYERGRAEAQPEIVRCKDCKHRDPEDKRCDCGHDILWQLPREDEWYCADAERRADGN